MLPPNDVPMFSNGDVQMNYLSSGVGCCRSSSAFTLRVDERESNFISA